MRGLRSEILTNCWVIVDAPDVMRPWLSPVTAARIRGEPIDSVMPEKAFILRGEHRIDHVSRHFIESQLVAETLRDPRFAQRNSISIEQRNALHRRSQQRRRDRHEAKAEMPCDEQQRQDDKSATANERLMDANV